MARNKGITDKVETPHDFIFTIYSNGKYYTYAVSKTITESSEEALQRAIQWMTNKID